MTTALARIIQRASSLSPLALGAPFLICSLPSSAAITLRFEQMGADVVVSGSGSANLDALTGAGSSTMWTNYFSETDAYVGPDAFNNGSVSLYSGLSGPTVFGSVPGLYELPVPSGSNGDLFGIQADDGIGQSILVLPDGYNSGDSLKGVSTYQAITLAQLGLTPGQMNTWTWGSGANADSLRLEVAPAPVPLLGAVAGFRMARTLRRRLRAAAVS